MIGLTMIQYSQFDCNFLIKKLLKLSAKAIWFSSWEIYLFRTCAGNFFYYREHIQSNLTFSIYYDPFILFLIKKLSIFSFLLFSSRTSFFHITRFLVSSDRFPCNTYSYILSHLLSIFLWLFSSLNEGFSFLLCSVYFSKLFTQLRYFSALVFYLLFIFHFLSYRLFKMIQFEETKLFLKDGRVYLYCFLEIFHGLSNIEFCVYKLFDLLIPLRIASSSSGLEPLLFS